MYLRHTPSGDMVEILDIRAMVDPFQGRVAARFHAGEELQEQATFAKAELVFPSGEGLPRCWVDPEYRSDG